MRRYLSFRDFDWPLLGMVMLLCTISVFEIYSATLHTKYAGFHIKQLYWISGGIVAMFIMSKIDYHKLLDIVWYLYGFFLLGLVGVKLFGHKALGGKRWIKMGPISFQPSEWFKLVLIVLMALYFANLGGRRLTWPDIFKAIALVGLPMLLVLMQPDLGTALTYTPILLAGLFLGGINWKQAAILATVGLVAIVGVWTSGKVLKPYQKARLTSFMDPDNDPKGSGYQVKQSLIAVGSGGIFGRGLTEGIQKLFFLPEPHTDFIFANICEELGLIGALCVVAAFCIVGYRGLRAAFLSTDPFARFLAFGLTTAILVQAFFNMSVVIALLPTKGIPLPFISSGGTSVFVTLACMGVLLNVTREID